MGRIQRRQRAASRLALSLAASIACLAPVLGRAGGEGAQARGLAAALEGEWQGAIRLEGEWSPARLRLRGHGDALGGDFDLHPLGVRRTSMDASLAGETVVITLEAVGLARTELAGRLEDGILCSLEAARTSFVFVRVPAFATDPQEHLGWYETRDGSTFFLTQASEGGLRFFRAGIAGTLLPLGPDRSCIAYVDQSAGLDLQEVRFAREGGAVRGLEVVDRRSGATQTARKVRGPGLRQERVRFASGELELAGLWLVPDDEAPHPALVFVQGTGYSTADRAYEMSLAAGFLEHGFGVLLFDKRGCGGSTGDWRTASLDDLATDVAAAVALVRARPEVAAERVGLYGISEGGWVAPLAVAKARGLAWLVNQGGPAVSPLEDELDDLGAGIAQLRFGDEDRDVALELAHALVDLYRSPEAWSRFRPALAAAGRRPWFAPMSSRIPQVEGDWRIAWWRKRGRLDPVPLWRELAIPALVVIGERDDTMDVAKNLALFERLRGENPRIEIRGVPGADHGLRVGREVAPELLADLAEWMLRASGG